MNPQIKLGKPSLALIPWLRVQWDQGSVRDHESCRGIYAHYENLEKFTAVLLILCGWYEFSNLILTASYPIGYPIICTHNFSIEIPSLWFFNTISILWWCIDTRMGVLKIPLGLSRREESWPQLSPMIRIQWFRVGWVGSLIKDHESCKESFSRCLKMKIWENCH